LNKRLKKQTKIGDEQFKKNGYTALRCCGTNSNLNRQDYGKRQGFLLGLGAGIGQLNYEQVQHDKVGPDPEDGDTSALAFMPKLGYAFTDQFALIYSRHPWRVSQAL